MVQHHFRLGLFKPHKTKYKELEALFADDSMPVFVYDNETTTPSNSKGTWACKYKNRMVILFVIYSFSYYRRIIFSYHSK